MYDLLWRGCRPHIKIFGWAWRVNLAEEIRFNGLRRNPNIFPRCSRDYGALQGMINGSGPAKDFLYFHLSKSLRVKKIGRIFKRKECECHS